MKSQQDSNYALVTLGEFFAIAKSMAAIGITPDFIVIDGSAGGTRAAPVAFTDYVGSPLC